MASFRNRDPRTLDPPPAYALCKSCRHIRPSNLDCKVTKYRCKKCDISMNARKKENMRALIASNAKRRSEAAEVPDETDEDIMAAQLARFNAAQRRRR